MTENQVTNASQVNMDRIRTWVAATNRNDVEAELACWQPDGEFHILPTNTTYHGLAEIREGGKKSAMLIGGQPIEGRKQIINLDAGDDWATVEYKTEATITGPIVLQNVTILLPGASRDLALKACLLFQMRQGKIWQAYEVFDSFSMAQQLGLDQETLAKLYASLGAPSEPSPKTRTPEETARLFIETWNQKDLEGLVALLADPVNARNPLTQQEVTIPKANFRSALQNSMANFPDLTMRLDRLIVQGDGVAIEEMENATYAATQRTYLMPVASFIRVNPEGLICEIHNYWDTATYFQQLGMDAEAFSKVIYGEA
jgi:steroid delta-isomerase-like uncharacterized protein